MNNGKICVSVCAETAEKLIEQINLAKDLADVIEIRFDCLEPLDLENIADRLIINKLEKLRESLKKPFLITFRAFEEGGVKKITLDKDRIPFWEDLKLNLPYFADFVDCEWELLSNIKHSWRFYENVKESKIIGSLHNFYSPINDFNNLESLFTQMSDLKLIGSFTGSFTETFVKREPRAMDVIKIAVLTNDISDSIAIWKLLKYAKSEDKQLIPIAMGESGKWTRILGLAHGAFMTYASLDSENETAPGQVSAEDLIKVYRAKELDENTDVYGIIGNPVSHSVSPEMQNAAFKFHNLNAVYIPFEVQNLDEFITRMVKPETREIDLNFKGFSVTIPHKQSIIKHLDFIDDTAKTIGAVNTIKIVDGKLYGYNTDAQGFIEPLKNVYGDLKDANVAIFGAGGSARACVYALKKEGANVTIFARDIAKAKSFADEFEVDFKELSDANFDNFEILVNTTPLGMKGKFAGETPVIAGQIANVKLVYDLVFNPFQTNFMTEADKANVPKIAGMAMLVAQGAAQFKIWSGKVAPLKEMSQAVLRKLQK